MPHDLVLSGGYLAFGRQAGFLAAVEDAGIEIDGVCGTSSGALSGALWASGHRAADIFERLTDGAPVTRVVPNLWTPWRGMFALSSMISELRTMIPATFEELDRPLAVGVMTLDGGHELIHEGPLPEAVAASCAIPWLFTPVRVGDREFLDGGWVDRVALEAWRQWRPGVQAIVHIVDSRREPDPDPVGLPFVRSPKSGASLWGLGDARGRFDETRTAALQRFGDLGLRVGGP